eukprot:scaffold181011_cov65-Attheya_sp.AAC.1
MLQRGFVPPARTVYISVACSHRTLSHEDDLMKVDTPIKSAIVKRRNKDGMSCQSPPLFGIKTVVPN